MFTNACCLGEKVFLDTRQVCPFVAIDRISSGTPKADFKFIQFKESDFLHIQNAQQSVCRKIYADGSVAVINDTIARSLQVNGSDAIDQWYKNIILNQLGSSFSVDSIEYSTQQIPHQGLNFLIQSLPSVVKKHSLSNWGFLQLQQQTSNGEPEVLPAFSVIDARENKFSDKDLQKGIFLINFWGTWCGPCIASMPKLVKLSKKFDGKVQFISYAMEMNSNNLTFEAAEKKYGISWKSFYENRKTPTGIADIFRLGGFPTYILIKDGLILKKSLSASGLPQIESLIERLLKEEN